MNIVTTVTVKREHKQLMKKFRNKIIIVNYQPSFKIIKFCKHNLKMVLRQSKKIVSFYEVITLLPFSFFQLNHIDLSRSHTFTLSQAMFVTNSENHF